MRLTPRRQAIFWGAVGLVTLTLSLWKGWLVLDLWGMQFPLGVLAAVYAGLQLAVHIMTRRHVPLTAEEVTRHGKALEEATPQILEMLKAGRSVQLVAREIEEERGLPTDVTHRYIIVLMRVLQKDQTGLLVPRGEAEAEQD